MCTYEIGIRKVFGAQRKDILKITFLEYFLSGIIAFGCCLVIIKTSIPYVNQYLNTELFFSLKEQWHFILIFFAITLFLSFISGSYLAFFLSRYNPTEIFNERNLSFLSSSGLKKVLLVFQFIIFIFLLFSVVVIEKQYHFLQSKPMGFNKENLFFITPESEEDRQNYAYLKADLLKNPAVKYVSGGLYCPPSVSSLDIQYTLKDDQSKNVILDANFVDYDFVEAYEFNFLEGRSFSKDLKANSNEVILTQKALELMDIKDPIGKATSIGTVIGVFENIHTHSFHHELKPGVIFLNPGYIYGIVVKTNNQKKETISFMNKVLRKHLSNKQGFQRFEDKVNELYPKELLLKKIIRSFTIIAILLASFGLFSISLFVSKQKYKETAIRKILGSSNSRVVFKFISVFLKLFIIAVAIAIPLSTYFMNKWLHNFAYAIDIGFSDLFLSFLIAISIVLTIVSYVSLNLVKLKPNEAIKSL